MHFSCDDWVTRPEMSTGSTYLGKYCVPLVIVYNGISPRFGRLIESSHASMSHDLGKPFKQSEKTFDYFGNKIVAVSLDENYCSINPPANMHDKDSIVRALARLFPTC